VSRPAAGDPNLAIETAATVCPAASPLLERQPAAVLFRGPGSELTAARLLACARELASRLPAGANVINVCQDRFDFTVALLAALSIGRAVLLPANRHPATVQALLDLEHHACLVHDEDAVPDVKAAHLIRAVSLRTGIVEESPVPLIADHQLCVIAFTSGSTGIPKANPKPWQTLRDGARINGERVFGGLGDGATVVATVPPQHMYGLETSILAPMFLPLSVYTSRPFYPADIAAALEAVAAPRILVTTPIHLRALLEAGLRLPEVARVISATAPLAPGLARAAEGSFADEVLELYGCTETGCLASRRCALDEPWQLFPQFSLDPGAGPAVVSAAHLAEAVELNDVLEVSSEGRFRIVGRSSDLLNVAGMRGSLAQLTMQLLAVPGVRDGVVFVPDSGRDAEVGRVAAFVVTDRPVRAVLGELARLVHPVFLPRPLLAVSLLPRLETGKLDHGAISRLWAARRSR
jgi:acyl-coenzyme A synthetase/AMP-(fatty) acid ligase